MKACWSVLGCVAALCAAAADFPITGYGAKADGSKCTAAFARAMAAADAAGGGRVVVPEGKWFTGAIRFKSNCELHLSDGATVLFSQDPDDYLPAVHTSWEGLECWNYCPLVYAYCCTNVAITGTGTLLAFEGEWKDTSWYPWVPQENGVRAARRRLYDWGAADHPVERRQIWKMKDAHTRPHFVQFNRCKGVRWENFRVRNSPFWTLHLYLCDGVTVRGLDVKANGSNNDGIDIEMTKNVLVERCRFDQGDDGVVIKSGRNRDAWRLHTPTENVLVRDCEIVNAHTLLGVGSEISGGVRNIRVENCTGGDIRRIVFVKTNRRRGATLEDIRVKGVRVKNASESIVEVDADVLYEWAKFPDCENRLTVIRNVEVSDVVCGETDRMIRIRGDAGCPVRGVHVSNVRAGRVNRADYVTNAQDVTVDGKEVRADAPGWSVSCPDVYVLANGYGRVEISRRGGRLLSWTDRSGREILFLPARKESPDGEWSHGGIPVCWPWFGRKDGVIHGFIRNKRLELRRQTADSVTLGYALKAGEEKSFPFAADLELTLTLGEKVTFAMRTRNTGGVPFACVDGMDRGFVRATDGAFSFTDRSQDRQVSARATGNSHVIVWTPGKAEPPNRNLGPGEPEWFIGYGPALTEASGGVVLRPGETHELALEMSSRSL